MARHVHADLIHAWAEGNEIQALQSYGDLKGTWKDIPFPQWDNEVQYRIKPEKKPDSVVLLDARFDGLIISGNHWNNNLRLTFDSDTGKLKKAEVING